MTAKQRLYVVIVTIIMILRLMKLRRRSRERLCTSSLPGKLYVQELLSGSSTNVYDLLRMKKNAFIELCDHFRGKGWLTNSKYLDVEEKMAIFLYIVSHNCRYRLVRERFQHSIETISKYFHEVLWAMLHFSQEMIVPPKFDGSIGEIRQHRRLRQGPFKGAVGALDGTLINTHVPIDKQIPFRGRGGKECFQNVMAICDFDMKFIYVMAGWEGIVHDSRVLNETLRDSKNKFPMPPEGMYYLCDAAYTHTRGFMCPYKSTRYWLPDFRRGGNARNRKEKFNHAHAKLRNVIERSFGVLKARFAILRKMPSYSFRTQVHVVVACMAIHNFLHRISLNDPLFTIYENEDVIVPAQPPMNVDQEDAPPSYAQIFGAESQQQMVTLRDEIANELYNENYLL